MASTREYEEAYKKLNAKQKNAVDSIYGPVFVIAGPGTGKTQMLALRIGNILLKSTGTKADEILALTFTESAVATLRSRLASFIGSSAYRVRIHTFHSFASSILDLRPDLFPRIALGKQLSDIAGITLIEKLLDKGDYSKIRNPKNPYNLAKSILHFIGELKKEYYTPEKYLADLKKDYDDLLIDPERYHSDTGRYAGKEKTDYIKKREKLEKHIEVAQLFSDYEEALERDSLYDYNDLINEAIYGLENNEAFRAEVGERSQFVLADEHQDANASQNRLLELITDFDGEPNLFIVGDEKQAIYRFQGASLESFFYFKNKYPSANIISLDENYRSKSSILETAHTLMDKAPVPDKSFRPILKAVRGNGGEVKIIECDTPREEYENICEHIKHLIDSGAKYEDIAILTKNNADVIALGRALREYGIPEDHSSPELNATDHPAIKLFINLIKALSDLSNDAVLSKALFIPGVPVSSTEIVKIFTMNRECKTIAEIIKESGSKDFQEWFSKIEKLSKEMRVTPLFEWVALLASESGFISSILKMKESADAYDSYRGFMDEVAILSQEDKSATAIDLLNRLEKMEEHSLRIKRPRAKRAGVQIMTVHKAKGLEFPHIIIAHTNDEKWFSSKRDSFSLIQNRDDGDENDIRRLLYVAITRAKDSVLITRSNLTEDDRAQTWLRFISDIDEHIKKQDKYNNNLPILTEYKSYTILDKEFLKDRLLSQGFSPTSFNNFIKSPWEYYFRSLLLLPSTQELRMMLGTAVHFGLKAYADAFKSGDKDIKNAIKAFHFSLNNSPIREKDRRELEKRGEEIIKKYIEQEGNNMQNIYNTEFKISASITVPGVGELPIKGMLDRIDILDDGTVSVIDYKTGKAKSENEIKGLTKNSDGDNYRQLIFYKMLLDKDGRYKMREGALHFVEPDDKGRCIIRKFVITDEEVKNLEKEIIKSAQDIASGEAFNTICDREKCNYCDLVDIMLSNR